MSFYWPMSAARSASEPVPGSSTWVAASLHAANQSVLASAEQVHATFLDGIGDIDRFMRVILDSDDAALAELLHECESPAKPPKVSPSKASRSVSFSVKREPEPVIESIEPIQPAKSIEPTVVPAQPAAESAASPAAPPTAQPTVETADESFQKVQLSIRRDDKPKDAVSTVKSPKVTPAVKPVVPVPPTVPSKTPSSTKTMTLTKLFSSKTPAKTPAKTPRKSANFASLPRREPLTISSTVVRSSAKKSEAYEVSPIRRNRFPSIADNNSPKSRRSSIPPLRRNNEPKLEPVQQSHRISSPSIDPVGSIFQRSRNVFFDRSTDKSDQTPLASSASDKTPQTLSFSPAAKAPWTSKTPSRAKFSLSSSEASKPISRSPTRYDTKQSKNSSVTSTRGDDTESFRIDTKPILEADKFMSPTKSSSAKTTKPPVKLDEITTKNRFLTTNLNPNSTNLPRPSGPSVKGKSDGKAKADSLSLSTKKSLMVQRSEAAALQPKKKIIISMNHKEIKLAAPPSTVSSALGVASKLAETRPSRVTESKRRPLTGNAVALPEAARPGFRAKSGIKRAHDTTDSVPANPFNILPDSNELPDINTDDEDNAGSKVLKSWAQSPELHRLVLKNKDIDPKSVFGEVPPFKIEDLFESEASRLRGAPSPIKMARSNEIKRFKSSYA